MTQFVVLSLLFQCASNLYSPRCQEQNAFGQMYKIAFLLSKTFLSIQLQTQYHNLKTLDSKGCCWSKLISINFSSSLQIYLPLSWAYSLRKMKTSIIWPSAPASVAVSLWIVWPELVALCYKLRTLPCKIQLDLQATVLGTSQVDLKNLDQFQISFCLNLDQDTSFPRADAPENI